MSTRAPVSLSDAIAVTKLWTEAGGKPDVELGALEPLLWQDGNLRIPDLVRGLKQQGVRVTMTSNASHLKYFASDLKAAGLDLLRISWHTSNAKRFREISGHGD